MNKFWNPILFGFFVALTTVSCNETNTEKIDETVEDEVIETLSLDERAKREAMLKLQIPPTENFSIKKHTAHLNGDDQEDAIFTINRLEFALERASKSKNQVKLAEMGYVGNYNYFIFYDGKLDRFSVPILVPSSPKTELQISFENVLTDAYQDVIVEYRIRNSAYRNYYQILDGSLAEVFQWKVFDYLGTTSPESFAFKYEPGSYSLSKDIVIYTGKIKNYPTEIPDTYAYFPEIESTDKEVIRFFFDSRKQKYSTTTRPD